jgi:hypothetical protein
MEKEVLMSKIFVRHRRHAEQGTGSPRFAIVAVEGVDLRVYRAHVRRAELEKIAADIDAELVYLPRGEHADAPEDESLKGRHRRKQDKEQRKKDKKGKKAKKK